METLLRYLDEQRGRRLELAKALNCRPSAISQWRRVPIDRVTEVERLTGIPRHELRPDIFKQDRPLRADERLEA